MWTANAKPGGCRVLNRDLNSLRSSQSYSTTTIQSQVRFDCRYEYLEKLENWVAVHGVDAMLAVNP